ncbi:hypothetical protein EJ110_NYTH18646 [Nymphaea thermarum]|nr:hypothetical protein EJ110_NYTH18646 [Nymphaea thermarum]
MDRFQDPPLVYTRRQDPSHGRPSDSSQDVSSTEMRILGNPITIEGAEYSKIKAIYISNHASPLDIFLVMWLTPKGTVGIAKKEVNLNYL